MYQATCNFCQKEVSGETIEEVVKNLAEHLKAEHRTELVKMYDKVLCAHCLKQIKTD